MGRLGRVTQGPICDSCRLGTGVQFLPCRSPVRAGPQHRGFGTQLLGESSEGCFWQLVIVTPPLHSYGDFHAYRSMRKARTYICKPDNSCQGRGIFITHHPEEIKHGERMICQQYISEVPGQSWNTGVGFQHPPCSPGLLRSAGGVGVAVAHRGLRQSLSLC